VNSLEPEQQQALVSMAPLPLKLVWWCTRGRFARLEAGAFGGIDVDLSDLDRTVPV